jgi:molybdopterin-guanine dinucleotide biosynthesis protein A/GNAT superfamily N-acetyltransferase
VAAAGLTGVLLVGGASRRFGTPKALAELGGETLAARAWRLLGETCDERIAVGKPSDELELPFDVVDDGTDVRAPIAGLVQALRIAHHDLVVAVPVDVPLLRAEDVRALAAAARDAAVPPSGPLPGAYRKAALPALERALRAGELALHRAVAELDVAVVDIPPVRLANVNTPEELAQLAEPRIVPLAPEHGDGLRAFVVSALGEFGFSEDAEYDTDLQDPASAYAAAWVVEVAGEVAGSVVLLETAKDELLLRRMYLAEGLRGRGLGRALLERALAWARERGYRYVHLDTTDAMVAARALYESAGFREVGAGVPREGRCRIVYRLAL